MPWRATKLTVFRLKAVRTGQSEAKLTGNAVKAVRTGQSEAKLTGNAVKAVRLSNHQTGGGVAGLDPVVNGECSFADFHFGAIGG